MFNVIQGKNKEHVNKNISTTTFINSCQHEYMYIDVYVYTSIYIQMYIEYDEKIMIWFYFIFSFPYLSLDLLF